MSYHYRLTTEFYTGVKRALALSTLGSSTTVAAPHARRPLAAAIASSSTAVATFASRRRALTATGASTSAVSATLLRKRPISATGASAGTTAVTIHGSHALTLAAASTGAFAATPHRRRALACSAAASGAVGAVVQALHPGVNVLVSGSTSVTASLSRSRALSSAATASLSSGATLHATHVLTAAVASVGVMTAAPARRRPIAASGASSSLFFAENHRARLIEATGASRSFASLPFLIRAQPVEFDARSTLIGTIKLGAGRGLAAQASSVSVLSASPQRPRALLASGASAGAVLAAIGRRRFFAASGNSTSALAALLVRPRRVVTVVAGRRVAIPGAVRVTLIPSEAAELSGTTTTAFDPMDPADVDLFTFDWSSRASAANPVLTATVTAIPPVVTIGTPIIAPTLVQVECSAGPADPTSVGLLCIVTLGSGRTLQWTARLPITQL